MDADLDARYRALFDIYREVTDPIGARTHELIVSWIVEYPDLLRSDAAYFLLVNFDHMIVRSQSWHVHPVRRQEREVLSKIEEALNIILSAVLEEERPVSAHRVMKAIDRRWAELAVLFAWA